MKKSNSTKKALIASILSVMVCVSLLIGTTFAWFTDTATAKVNKIQAGTLDVALIDVNGTSIEGATLGFVKAQGHQNEAILWEPGCTYELEPFKIANKGNLALKYKVQISGIKGDAKLNEAIVWTINGDGIDSEGHLKPGETSATLTISGHMKEEAGNEYQGLSIEGAAITVIATQYTHEYDSEGNQYDINAAYSGNIDDLKADLAIDRDNADANKQITINLNKDYDLNGSNWDGLNLLGYDAKDLNGFKVVINGNNHVINGMQSTGDHAGLISVQWSSVSFEINNLTIANSTFICDGTDADKGAAAFVSAPSNTNLKLNNCHVLNCKINSKHYAGGLVGYATLGASNGGGGNIEITNCSVEGTEITGTRIGAIVGMNGGSSNGASLYINNPTVKDVTLTATKSVGSIIGANNGLTTLTNPTLDDVNAILNGTTQADLPYCGLNNITIK